MTTNTQKHAPAKSAPDAKKPASFDWISAKRFSKPYVTIDSQNRLYISAGARELLGLPAGSFRLIAGYDLANNRIVLAKPEVVRVPDVRPFKFDKRAYSNARRFVEQARLSAQLPAHFEYAGREFSEYPDGSYTFELR